MTAGSEQAAGTTPGQHTVVDELLEELRQLTHAASTTPARFLIIPGARTEAARGLLPATAPARGADLQRDPGAAS